MNPVVVYTLLRLTLFVLALSVLYFTGARGVLAIVLAAVVSLVLSYLLLGRQREAMAERIARRVQERKDFPIGTATEDTEYEDAVDDELRREHGEDGIEPRRPTD